MTPFEKAGYTKDMVFEVSNQYHHRYKQRFTIAEDDGSDLPFWHKVGSGELCALYLHNVAPVVDEPPVPEQFADKVRPGKVASDGTSASYYELPAHATQLYHLILHKNMNAQLGEIFRSAYRYGESSHSDALRDIRKIKTYAIQEEERILRERGEYVPEAT